MPSGSPAASEEEQRSAKTPKTTEDVKPQTQLPTEDMDFPHGFMYLRLSDLRGFEEIMVDFAEEPPELPPDEPCDE